MFQFTWYRLLYLCIQYRITRYEPCGVPPFGHLRVEAYLQLTAAYRSLPRPSSPLVCQVIHYKPFVAWSYRKLPRLCITLHFIIVKEHDAPPIRWSQIYAKSIVSILSALTRSTKQNGAEEDWTPDPLLAKQVLSQTELRPLEKWARGGSNHWPRPYQGRALTNWATGP